MARMSVSAAGPDTSPGKMMFYLDMLFVVTGVVIGIGGFVGTFTTGEPGMVMFSVMFIVMFCGIGSFFAKIGYDNMRAADAVLEEGATYLGKIFAHEPDHQLIMNGRPCITLVVRYLVMELRRDQTRPTSDSKRTAAKPQTAPHERDSPKSVTKID